MDLKQVLRELEEMRRWFVGCADLADGEIRKRFEGYVCVLVEVAQVIRDRIAEEDDGK